MNVTWGRSVPPEAADQAGPYLVPGETLLGLFALKPGPDGSTLLVVTDQRLLGMHAGAVLLSSTRPAVHRSGSGMGHVLLPDSGLEVHLRHPIELMTLRLLPPPVLPSRKARPRATTPAPHATLPPDALDALDAHVTAVPQPRSQHRDPTRMQIGLATWLYTAVGLALYVWVSAYLGFWPLWLLLGASLILFIAWLLGRDAAVAATHAVPASPGQYPAAHRHVAELAQQAGITTPTLYISGLPAHNAFAARLPHESLIAITEPLLTGLSDQELRAVLAHEIGHLRNRDTLLTQVYAAISLAATILVALLGFALAVVAALATRRQRDADALGMLIGLLMLTGAIVAAAFHALGSRHRELMADEAATELTDGNDLISALEKIDTVAATDSTPPSLGLALAAPRLFVSPFGGSILGALLASHPSTNRRIRRLRRRLDRDKRHHPGPPPHPHTEQDHPWPGHQAPRQPGES